MFAPAGEWERDGGSDNDGSDQFSVGSDSGDSIPIIMGYDSSLQEYEQRSTDKVAALLQALDDKMYKDNAGNGYVPSPAASPLSSARSSPPNLYSLERRHNFETHNRPQVANRKPQPSEWTRVFPFIRVRGIGPGLGVEDVGELGCPSPQPLLDGPAPPPTPSNISDALRRETDSVLPWSGLVSSGCGGLVVVGRLGQGNREEGETLAAQGECVEEVLVCEGRGGGRSLSHLCEMWGGEPPEAVPPLGSQSDPEVTSQCIVQLRSVMLDGVWAAVTHALRPLVDVLVHDVITVTERDSNPRGRVPFKLSMPTFQEEDSGDLSEEDVAPPSAASAPDAPMSESGTHSMAAAPVRATPEGNRAPKVHDLLLSPVVVARGRPTPSPKHAEVFGSPRAAASPRISPLLFTHPMRTCTSPVALSPDEGRARVKFRVHPLPHSGEEEGVGGGGAGDIDDSRLKRTPTHKRMKQGRLRLLVGDAAPPVAEGDLTQLQFAVTPAAYFDKVATTRSAGGGTSLKHLSDLRTPVAHLSPRVSATHTHTHTSLKPHTAWHSGPLSQTHAETLARTQTQAVTHTRPGRVTSAGQGKRPRAVVTGIWQEGSGQLHTQGPGEARIPLAPVVKALLAPKPHPPLPDSLESFVRLSSRGPSGDEETGSRAHTALPRLRASLPVIPTPVLGPIGSDKRRSPREAQAVPRPGLPPRISPRTTKIQLAAAGAHVVMPSPDVPSVTVRKIVGVRR